MRKRATKNLVFLSSALVIIGIGSVVVHRFPLLTTVMSLRDQYDVHRTPGMYAVPSLTKALNNSSCAPLDRESTSQIEIGELRFNLPTSEIVSEQGASELYRIEFTGKRVLVVVPRIPPIEELAPGGSTHLKEKFAEFLRRNDITTHRELVSYMLHVTPSDLSLFDEPIIMTGKMLSLHLKVMMVPREADHAYEFSLGQKLTGYLVSRRGNDQALTFVHLFDERDRHHQLIFSSFDEEQITCTLNRVTHVG